jgi:hypothetical protein
VNRDIAVKASRLSLTLNLRHEALFPRRMPDAFEVGQELKMETTSSCSTE